MNKNKLVVVAALALTAVAHPAFAADGSYALTNANLFDGVNEQVGIGIDVNVVLTQDYFEHARAAFWNLYLSPEGIEIASTYKSEDTLDFVCGRSAVCAPFYTG